jgi:hypothetical protein
MINLYGQGITETIYQEKELIAWHTPSNHFDRFDLYFYVNIYYGKYERYATDTRIGFTPTVRNPPVPLCWSVCEHC